MDHHHHHHHALIMPLCITRRSCTDYEPFEMHHYYDYDDSSTDIHTHTHRGLKEWSVNMYQGKYTVTKLGLPLVLLLLQKVFICGAGVCFFHIARAPPPFTCYQSASPLEHDVILLRGKNIVDLRAMTFLLLSVSE